MNYKQVIIIRKDLKLGVGKVAVQCSHASIEALEKMKKKFPQWIEEWKKQGQAKIVLRVEGKKELLELFEKLKKEFPTALIKDAGRTQVEKGKITCLAVGPLPENKINPFTKKLKLL